MSSNSRRVLLIGSGGPTKFGFLERLLDRADELVVIDPPYLRNSGYPTGADVRFADFSSIGAVEELATKVNREGIVNAVGSIWEFSIEAASRVRAKLGLPGLQPELAPLVRNKAIMGRFLQVHGLPVPRFVVFPRHMSPNDSLDEVAQLQPPLVIKPTCGGANLGVRKVECAQDIDLMLSAASMETDANPFAEWFLTDVGAEWIVSEYVQGIELEADVGARRSEIYYACVQEKTINLEVRGEFEEVRSVTPPLSLDAANVIVVRKYLERLVDVVWKHIAAPSGDVCFQVYPEFRVTPYGEVITLEIGYRPGGGSCPATVLASTGIDVFDFAAACTVRQEPVVTRRPRSCGVCAQLLYGGVSGQFIGIVGAEPTDGIQLDVYLTEGTPIATPHSQYVGLVVSQAASAILAERHLDRFLKGITVLVRSPYGDVIPARPPTRFDDCRP